MRDQLKMLRSELRTLPNQMTAARIAMLPLLWAFALLSMPIPVGIGLIISFVTDVLDGYFARRLGQVSAFGSKFDSLADNLLIPSGLVWLWMLRPEVYREHILICLTAIGLYFTALLVGLLKFRRFANLHLQSARIGAVAIYAFASHAFIANHYSPLLFYIAVGIFMLSDAEGLLLQLICAQVDEHMGSILFFVRRRSAKG
jgi:phosphatidylglycerophosphate synthase